LEKQANRTVKTVTMNEMQTVHADSERAITGLWTTPEMEKALEKGYKIARIYDVWHFEQSSTDLWMGYIRKFLKIKLETSKLSCREEKYQQKARQFGIELDELRENPGLGFIAKICLNSLWGKFGQNPKVKHSEYIDSERGFDRLILNDKIHQISLSSLNDTMVYANYEIRDEFVKTSYNINIYIACFATSWARLRLYNMLEKLDRNVCYCDTQTVLYTLKMNRLLTSISEMVWENELTNWEEIIWSFGAVHKQKTTGIY